MTSSASSMTACAADASSSLSVIERSCDLRDFSSSPMRFRSSFCRASAASFASPYASRALSDAAAASSKAVFAAAMGFSAAATAAIASSMARCVSRSVCGRSSRALRSAAAASEISNSSSRVLTEYSAELAEGLRWSSAYSALRVARRFSALAMACSDAIRLVRRSSLRRSRSLFASSRRFWRRRPDSRADCSLSAAASRVTLRRFSVVVSSSRICSSLRLSWLTRSAVASR